MRLLILIVLHFLFFWTSKSIAQELYSLDEYNIDDGLSDRTVWDIEMDKNGLIWLATGNGIDRFDGYRFQKFSSFSNTPFQLSSIEARSIHPIFEDQFIILYSDQSIVDIIDPLQLTLRHLDLKRILGNTIKSVNVCQDEIYILSEEDDRLSISKINEDLDVNLVVDVSNSSGISNYTQFTRLEEDHFIVDNTLIHAHGTGVPQSSLLHRSNLKYIVQDKEKTLLIFQNTPGVYYVSKNQLLVDSRFDESQYYYKIWKDKKGNLLSSTTASPRQNYPDLKSLILTGSQGKVKDLSYLLEIDKKINFAQGHDFEKQVIIGTHKGLKIANINQKNVERLLYDANLSRTFGTSMRSIVNGPKGTLFASAEVNNFFRINKKDWSVNQILNNSLIPSKELDEWSCSNQLFFEAPNTLWGVGCNLDEERSSYIFEYNCETEKLDKYPLPQSIQSFVKDENIIYAISNEGYENAHIWRWDEKNKTFESFDQLFGTNPLQNQFCKVIHRGRQNDLWVGTTSGLVKVNIETGEYTKYLTSTHPQLKSDRIICIEQSKPNELWLGTSAGLHLFEIEREKFTAYDRKDGLMSDIVCGIIPLDNNDIWLSTYFGISYYDRNQDYFKNFTSKDGLTDNEFNRFSYFKDEEDNIYFGGINGLNVFKQNDLIDNRIVPDLQITEISKYDSKRDSNIHVQQGLQNLKSIELSPHDLSLKIDFTLPIYDQPEKHQYYRWLEGFDPSWVYLGNQPFTFFPKLNAGNYTLHLKAADNSGNLTENIRSLDISVNQVLYKKTWFLLLCLFLLFSLLFAFFLWRQYQLKRLQNFKTKVAIDLHDEVSGLLASVANNAELIHIQSPSNQTKAIEQGSREAISKMSDIIWAINTSKDTSTDLLDRMKNYAHFIFESTDIDYKFDVQGLADMKRIDFKVKQDIYLIYKEAIHNILKHSNTKYVSVKIENNRRFIMEILDEGPPKINDEFKSANGLENMKKRAQRIGGELSINKGSRWVVRLERARI